MRNLGRSVAPVPRATLAPITPFFFSNRRPISARPAFTPRHGHEKRGSACIFLCYYRSPPIFPTLVFFLRATIVCCCVKMRVWPRVWASPSHLGLVVFYLFFFSLLHRNKKEPNPKSWLVSDDSLFIQRFYSRVHYIRYFTCARCVKNLRSSLPQCILIFI